MTPYEKIDYVEMLGRALADPSVAFKKAWKALPANQRLALAAVLGIRQSGAWMYQPDIESIPDIFGVKPNFVRCFVVGPEDARDTDLADLRRALATYVMPF